MIEVRNLTKLYGEFVAVNDLSFMVRSGEIMGLLGPNGAGKTTTLRCVAGMIPATKGTIQIAGHDVMRDPVAAKRELAFLPDEPRLFDYLTVEQHLNFTARMYQVERWQEPAARLLAELGLTDKKDALPAELSRGMKQKVVIACGLLHTPRVIFFDEPLTGLDPIGIRGMKETIRQCAREGAAVILSSHLLDLLEEVCTHVLILKNGRKIFDGSLDDVRRRFETGADVNLEEAFFRAIAEPTGDA